MSINIYIQLEKSVLPSLINFKEDLTKFDKELISSNKNTRFLYAYRANGTNILLLDKKRFINSSKEGVEKALRDSFDILKGHNKTYLYFNGETLVQIDFETLCSIYGSFAKEVRVYNEHIASLNLDLLVIDLYCLMRDFKKSWKQFIVNHGSNSQRKTIADNFNLAKIKTPQPFNYISNYADMRDCKEIKEIKKMLLDNLK